MFAILPVRRGMVTAHGSFRLPWCRVDGVADKVRTGFATHSFVKRLSGQQARQPGYRSDAALEGGAYGCPSGDWAGDGRYRHYDWPWEMIPASSVAAGSAMVGRSLQRPAKDPP
jgi:hypothetical protein